jgi:hypothetical protein
MTCPESFRRNQFPVVDRVQVLANGIGQTGKRRWNVHAGSKNTYVWQQGRFEEGLEFRRKAPANPRQIKPVNRDQCLRFYLETENDFQSFTEAVKSDLDSVTRETIG